MAALAAASVLSGLRVLVVEDEYMVAEHVSLLLEDRGCVVAGPVGTIEQALAIVAEGGLDVALLDANLDGASSAPIAAALRAAAVPFIMVTGYGGRDLSDEARNQAPRLSKPFSTYQLEETLIALLAREAAIGRAWLSGPG